MVQNPVASAGDIRGLSDSFLTAGVGNYPGGGNGSPLQDSCWRIPWTEEPGGPTVHRVTKSRTQLKRLSRHACKYLNYLLLVCDQYSHLICFN